MQTGMFDDTAVNRNLELAEKITHLGAIAGTVQACHIFGEPTTQHLDPARSNGTSTGPTKAGGVACLAPSVGFITNTLIRQSTHLLIWPFSDTSGSEIWLKNSL